VCAVAQAMKSWASSESIEVWRGGPVILRTTRLTSYIGVDHQRRKRKRKASLSPRQPTGPMIRADAAWPGTAGSNSSANGNARYAQTFTALASGALVRADIRIAKPAGTIGDYVPRLSAVDASHAPTNTVLALALLPDGTVADGIAMRSFAFPHPFTVVARVQVRVRSHPVGIHQSSGDRVYQRHLRWQRFFQQRSRRCV
jgi:hypothetical protein